LHFDPVGPPWLRSAFGDNMAPPVRMRIARICLAVGLVLFFSGFLVLCDCPEWFALAAAFTGIGVWLGTGRTRWWAIALFVAALLVTGLESYAKVKHEDKKRELRKKIQDREILPGSNNTLD
jgi:membrane protein implicated in regulation of membrane protease activity